MKKSQLISLVREVLQETIRKVNGKYVVYPEKGGKRLGTHSTRKAAEKQLTAIHLNKEGIDEVGEASAQPYKWKKSLDLSISKHYAFYTESGENYKVFLDSGNSADTRFEVFFAAQDKEGDWSYLKTTNKGELYRVMATVVDIIESFLEENPKVHTLFFTPSVTKDNKSMDNQRGRLYTAYIKRLLPDAEIKTGSQYITIKLPKREKTKVKENYADGKVKGKSRPGRIKNEK